MDAKSDAPNSRIYSTARMKRRENKQSKLEVNLPENTVSTINGTTIENSAFMNRTGKKGNHVKKHMKFNPDLENINPETRNERETQPRRYSRRNSMDAKHSQHERTQTEQRRISAFKENNFQKLSDSSLESSDSDPGTNTYVDELSNYSDSQKLREKFFVLCSLLPDEILNDPVNPKLRFYQTALMFPDVSGFTQLCQKYDKTGMGGPSRLTAILNGYIGSMIEIVLSRDGDVCKFGGDAFLCSWKVTKDKTMTEVVHLALESAIDIQKNCGEHKTDVGVKLRVKIAVSAGNAVFSIIGKSDRKHYVIVGPPVLEARDAEKLCNPGDVIVTPSAWNYVTNYMFYSFTYHADNKHIKVHDVGPLWKSSKSRKDWQQKNPKDSSRLFMKTELSIRIQDVRPFILPPVMKNIHLNRSLDHLTEMRQVAIVFFNICLKFGEMTERDIVSVSKRVFEIISERVDKADGATNKLTLFDKDMAVLTVFGLKGFKHELASQVALKCAFSCLEQLKHLKAEAASAGVTTGMAYCGVIGHPQRKEYTVMGHPVNMAARLMCTYQNIVSCDKSTFLNSKLESGHFELLETEYLKGIHNAGPFYRFNINPKRSKLKLDHEGQPILGRGKEVEQFETFLKRGSSYDSPCNFFIIFGEARIGKSRLVAKLINVAQHPVRKENSLKRVAERSVHRKERDIHIILLTEDDHKVSYSTVRLIFQPLLNLEDSASVEEKEDRIVSRLGASETLTILSSLNTVFNVNFEMTAEYLALGEQEQAETRMTSLKTLYNSCFPKGGKWLIVIEDAEFVDDESWNFLTWCSLESQKALYLLTIGQKKALSKTATNALDLIKAKRITLSEIEKWFYLGLACQILGVRAIPVELESLLQKYKSSGNPGWLESFLLSLIQSGSIYIGQAVKTNMKTMGLVAPPEFMLSNTVLEIKSDTSFWTECVDNFESATDFDRYNFRVCLLGPNFRTGIEEEGELTMDVMFIKTIDGLRPLVQLVLKAGSVIGQHIKRTVLTFVISKEIAVEERSLSKAIKTLFEMKILICGKGDLSLRNQHISRRLLDSSIRTDLTCDCIGLNIPETCVDLPRYANCGYMQFRFPTFRETVYNLLLDYQKKNFHNNCIEFLRKNTYKCKSCMGVRFTNVIGYEEDDQVVLACTSTPMHGVRSTTLDPKFGPPKNRRRKGSASSRLLSQKIQVPSPKTREGSVPSDYELQTIVDTDVGDCQCSPILASLYSVLLEHATGSGRKDLKLEIQLESASVNLFMYNFPLTMQILLDALDLVDEMKENKEHPEFCTPFIYGKIYTLMGAAKLNMGRLNESLVFLKTSLKYLKQSFPSSRSMTRMSITKHLITLKFTTQYFPEKFLGRDPNKCAHVTDLLSECLGLISVASTYKQNGLMAKNAALWSMNKALQSNRNLYVLCNAYANLMEVSYHDKDFKTCAKLEVFAIDVCRRCSSMKIEPYEWEAVGRLYKIIFQVRYVRAEIGEAVEIGFQSINIAFLLHSTNLKLDLIPQLILSLMQMDRLSEAVTLMQELEFISRLDSDRSSRLWYYAICLDFQLCTGFTIVPYEICENFITAEEDFTLLRDPFATHRLYTALWLWCIRNQEWELIKSYGIILKNSKLFQYKESPCSVFSRLQRLEGLLIIAAYKMEAGNMQSFNAVFAEAHVIMNGIKRIVKSVKVLKPRYQLLKAYYKKIKNREYNYVGLLDKAQAMADESDDKNTANWIRHTKLLWSNSLSDFERNFWVDHCRKNVIEWHETVSTKQPASMYSLPLPKF